MDKGRQTALAEEHLPVIWRKGAAFGAQSTDGAEPQTLPVVWQDGGAASVPRVADEGPVLRVCVRVRGESRRDFRRRWLFRGLDELRRQQANAEQEELAAEDGPPEGPLDMLR